MGCSSGTCLVGMTEYKGFFHNLKDFRTHPMCLPDPKERAKCNSSLRSKTHFAFNLSNPFVKMLLLPFYQNSWWIFAWILIHFAFGCNFFLSNNSDQRKKQKNVAWLILDYLFLHSVLF